MIQASGVPDVPATLIGLLERYSPSGQESEVVAWLVERMRDIGYAQTFVDPAGNAVGIKGNGSRQVVLLGHIDTVPGNIPVRLSAGRLFGRGAVDAKGPLAAFVDAAAQVEPPPGWQVVVLGCVDEERDSLGARYATGAYHPDFAVIAEPSRWDRVTLGYKGSAWAEIRVSRPVAHSAGQAENACETAVSLWNSIQARAAAFNQGKTRAFDQVLPALRGLASGSDGFDEWAALQVGVRLPPDLCPDAWYSWLCEIAGRDQVSQKGFSIPAFQAEKNTPLVRAFLSAIRSSGGKPGFVLKTGTADLNIVAPAWGCPAVAYGPGDSSLDHTPQEHIELDEYWKGVRVVRDTLAGLLQTA